MTEAHPLVILAQHGLFVTSHFSCVADAVSRPYSIRLAREADVPQLTIIEKKCWNSLALSHDRVLARICNHPSGQWVSKVGDVVVGILYTQQLPSTETLLQTGVNFDNQEDQHTENNPSVLQLLGVAVLPDFAHMQIGSGLRDFVLQLASSRKEIIHVVAMTRCSSATESPDMHIDKQISAYNQKAMAGADPTLSFHLGGGAKVVCTVPNYRPADTLNLGHAVYIQYTLKPVQSDEKKDSGVPVAGGIKNGSGATNTISRSMSMENLQRLLLESLDHADAVKAAQAKSINAFLDTSFMDFGLHSLAMVELQSKLANFLSTLGIPSRSLQNSRTWLFDFPTPRALLAEVNGPTVTLPDTQPTQQIVHADLGAASAGLDAAPSSACPTASHFAVVGMSCRLPGGINTPEEFHTALLNRVDTVVRVPEDWDWDAKTKHASLLTEDAAESFDAAFFNLNAAEAQEMDPHQRIILEVAHEALVNAQVLQQKSGQDRVGVFVGLCNNEWSKHASEELSPYTTTGSAQSAAANRVSYLLGLTGPSLVVDTACSSSLAALHTAINALRCGDCDVALVASADLLVSSHSLKIRESANMLSPDGRNRSFDENANGYVRGEGAGAIVLKTLARAETDRKLAQSSNAADASSVAQILAVIRGSAMNQDGRSASFTAPNGSAQRALLREALRVSGVRADEVSYVEAHGTGTSLGDPIEWGAIRDVLLAPFSADAPVSTMPLVIGALKSNIGHLEGCAGMAGLIKAINCVRARTVPANLHLQRLNSRMIMDKIHRHAHFPEDSVPLRSVTKANGEVIAGVSSFGSGGTNVHVILQSYTETVAEVSKGVVQSPRESVKSAKVVFLCAGQGLVYHHMGRELFEAEPVFKDCIVRCSLVVPLQPSLVEVMYTSPDCAPMIHTPVYSQLALFALEVALAYVWKTRGVSPDVVAGHSLGEYAAAVIAGVFTPEVGIQLVHLRLQSLIKFSSTGPTTGMMAAVRCSEADALKAIEAVMADTTGSAEDRMVALAGINGPNSVVLSGTEDAVKRLLSVLGNPSSKNLVVEYAFHSPLVLPAAQDFEKRFDAAIADGRIRFSTPLASVQLVSCLHGKLIDLHELTRPAYWVQQMLRPVRFLDCVRVLRSADVDARVITEIGPSNMFAKLAALSMTSELGNSCKFTSSLEKGTDALDQLNFAVTVVQKRSLLGFGTRGGRLSEAYRPTAMKWRQKGQKEALIASSGLRSQSYNQQSYLHEIVRSAILSVLSPEMVECLSGETSFLSLGLDSLAAQAVRNALATQLNLPQLSNTVVLKHPSMDELVEFLYAKIHAPEAPSVSAAQSRDETELHSAAFTPEAVFDIDDLPEDGVMTQFPASCMQQAMLFHHISDPDAKSFIETFRWDLSGEINMGHLHQAWISVITTHPSLRSSFDPYAVPVPLQRIWSADSIESLSAPLEKSTWFKIGSLAKLDNSEVEKAIVKELRAQRAVPFDLAVPLLPRIKILSRAQDKHVLLLTIHHAVIDGFSVQLLLQDLSRFYAAAASGKHLPVVEAPSYHAFVDFERHLVSVRNKAAHRFWSSTVQGWQS